METVKQNLQYVEKSLQNGTHKENGAMIQLLLEETIEAVREATFQFDMQYDNENYQNNVYTYITRIRKAKAELICMLAELQAEISKKNTNVKRCRVLIDKMLDTDLNTKCVQKTINKWVSLYHKAEIKTKTLHVK